MSVKKQLLQTFVITLVLSVVTTFILASSFNVEGIQFSPGSEPVSNFGLFTLFFFLIFLFLFFIVLAGVVYFGKKEEKKEKEEIIEKVEEMEGENE